MKYIGIIAFIFTTSFYGCKHNLLETGINREWSFDSIVYEKEDVMYCMNLNMLIFKDNGEVELPSIFDDCSIFPKSEIIYGEWKIIKKNKKIFLKIESKNKAFNDTYRLIFKKQKITGMLLAILESEKMKIKMSCALIPKGNENYIDHLVSLTN